MAARQLLTHILPSGPYVPYVFSHFLLPSVTFGYKYPQVFLNVMFSIFIFLMSLLKGDFILEVVGMEEFFFSRFLKLQLL